MTIKEFMNRKEDKKELNLNALEWPFLITFTLLMSKYQPQIFELPRMF